MSNQDHFTSRKVRIDTEESFDQVSTWKTTSNNNNKDFLQISNWPRSKSCSVSPWVGSLRRKENGTFPSSVPPPLNTESLRKSHEKDHAHLDLLCPSNAMDSYFHLSGVQSILNDIHLDDGADSWADAHCHNDHYHGHEAISKGSHEEFSVPLHRHNDFSKSTSKSTPISSPRCHYEERNITNNFCLEPFMYDVDDVDQRIPGYHKNGLHYFKDSRDGNNYERHPLENEQDSLKVHQRGNKTGMLHRDYHGFQNLKRQYYPCGRDSKSYVSKEAARENRFHQRFGQREFHHNVEDGKLMEKSNPYNDKKVVRTEKEKEFQLCNKQFHERVADTKRTRKPRTKGVLFRRGDDGRLIKC